MRSEHMSRAVAVHTSGDITEGVEADPLESSLLTAERKVPAF